mgnify:CR=1 FL=1
MFSILSHSFILLILVFYSTAQHTGTIDSFFFFLKNDFALVDRSHDHEGDEHDSEPMRNGGRGTHEANSQSNHNTKEFILKFHFARLCCRK